MYSATIVIWQILALEPLYPDIDSFEIMEFVGDKGGRPRVPEEWPEDLKKVLEDGWHQDPNTRCTASELHRRMLELLPENQPVPKHLLRNFPSNHSSKSTGDEPSSTTNKKSSKRSKSGIKWSSIMSLASSISVGSITAADSGSSVHPFDKEDDTTTTLPGDVLVVDNHDDVSSEAQHKGGESLESLEGFEEEKEEKDEMDDRGD